MTNIAYLKQRVNVRSTFKSMGHHSNPCINRLVKDIERRVTSNTAKTINRIGEEVGTVARYQQHAGIVHYRAIFTHRLYNSIQSKRTLSSKNLVKYEIATSLNSEYPYYLIKGRKEVKPVKRKALRFRLTPKGQYLFRTFVKPAKPKDYVKFADEKLQPMINGMVGRYVHELFR